MKRNVLAMVVVGVLVIGSGSFYAITQFTNKRPQVEGAQDFPSGIPNRQGFPSGMPNRQGGPNGMPDQQGAMSGRTIGEILSKDDKSITVKLFDGSSKVVLISASTVVSKMEAGSTTTGAVADLVVGENVMVSGEAATDGNINAESILLIGDFQRPSGERPPGMPEQ